MSKMIVDPRYLACWGRMKVKVNVGKVKVIVGQGHVKDNRGPWVLGLWGEGRSRLI